MKSRATFPQLKNKAILAPMAGFTDVAFRLLCKRFDCELAYTEFVSANAIVQGNEKTRLLLQTDKSERPRGVQIFGSDPNILGKAVSTIEQDFDIIDLNCGCPVPKIANVGAGSILMKEPEKMVRLVQAMTSNTNKPVTIKMRLGVDNHSINACEIAKQIEDAGASAIAVHGRTRSQGYGGKVDWRLIKKVKDTVAIPVIGNGDVRDPETFDQRLKESGVDYIMIGRGALGNPGIFRQIREFQKTGAYQQIDRLPVFYEYLKLAKEYKIRFEEIKHHAMFFAKGINGGAKLRRSLAKTKNEQELEEAIEAFRKSDHAKII